jgi:hypothetical protein
MPFSLVFLVGFFRRRLEAAHRVSAALASANVRWTKPKQYPARIKVGVVENSTVVFANLGMWSGNAGRFVKREAVDVASNERSC